MERTEFKGSFFTTLGAEFGRRYRFKKNLRQLAVSTGVGLELYAHRGLLRSGYSGKFTGTEAAVQAFDAAIEIWRGTW